MIISTNLFLGLVILEDLIIWNGLWEMVFSQVLKVENHSLHFHLDRIGILWCLIWIEKGPAGWNSVVTKKPSLFYLPSIP